VRTGPGRIPFRDDVKLAVQESPWRSSPDYAGTDVILRFFGGLIWLRRALSTLLGRRRTAFGPDRVYEYRGLWSAAARAIGAGAQGHSGGAPDRDTRRGCTGRRHRGT